MTLSDDFTPREIAEVCAEFQNRTFRDALFAGPMPDDLALKYQAIAEQHGTGTALRLLAQCRGYSEAAYEQAELPPLPTPSTEICHQHGTEFPPDQPCPSCYPEAARSWETARDASTAHGRPVGEVEAEQIAHAKTIIGGCAAILLCFVVLVVALSISAIHVADWMMKK